jgi:AraC-like DNA-binding protein
MLPHEQVIMWHQPYREGVALIRATYIEHTFPRHTHDYFAIGVIEEGFQQFLLGKQFFHTPPGGMFIINPGEVHTGESATRQGFAYRTIYPSLPMFEALSQEISGRARPFPLFTAPVIDDPELVRLFLTMHRTLEVSLSTLEAESCVHRLLAQVIIRQAPAHPAPRAVGAERREVARVRAYLDEHFCENITLQHLADYARLSPFYLNRVFRKEVGMPPYAYLENRRIQRAQHLLLADLPIADVAFQTGFSSQSHFTTSFKRYLGVPPAHYMRLRRGISDTPHESEGAPWPFGR